MTFTSLLENGQQTPSHLSAPASSESPSLPAITDYVLLNAAALLYISGRAKDWNDGVRIARESIAEGRAKAAFEGFRNASKKAMGEDVGVKVVEYDGGDAAKGGEVKSWFHGETSATESSNESASREKGED